MLSVCCAGALLLACGGSSDEGLYEPPPEPVTSGGGAHGGGGASGGACEQTGAWAMFVEVGVDWESATIKAGAGTTRQWILTHRTWSGTRILDMARVCGVGAYNVPLGSPWFSIVDIPELNILDEWTGVTFKAEAFDSLNVPAVEIFTDLSPPEGAGVGTAFTSEAKPFLMGAEGLDAAAPWPDVATLTPLMKDHDGDGAPGITGVPFQGQVPGEADGIVFTDPRLTVVEPILRAQALHMAVRTQAALQGTLVSCDPPTIEGTVVAGSLQIDSRVTACVRSESGEPCSEADVAFLDGNLPIFRFNGTSRVLGQRVPEDTTCADVRRMYRNP